MQLAERRFLLQSGMKKAGDRGLFPRDMALRMAAKFTTVGTSVKSCISTRAGVQSVKSEEIPHSLAFATLAIPVQHGPCCRV